MKELQAERERKAQRTKENKKDAIETAKRKRIEAIADRRQRGVEKSIKRAQSVAPRNLEKIDKEMGDGTAMSKMLGNVGKLAVGTTRSAVNLGKAAVKKAAALPAQARVARLNRKDEVESGIVRKLGSRLGRKDEYSRQRKLEKSKDRVAKAREAGIRQRAKSIKKAGEAKRERFAKYKQGANQSGPTQGPNPMQGPKAMQGPRERGGALAVRAKGSTALDKARESLRSKGSPAYRGNSSPNVKRDSTAIVKSGPRSKGQRARLDPEYRRKLIQQREEFIHEVQKMQDEKINKVINIMKGKNKIEINPKIKESMNWKDDYKPLEIETTNLIEPEKLNPSDWRSELNTIGEESDKKREERIKTRDIATKLTRDLPLDHPAFAKRKNDLRPTPGTGAMDDVRARIAKRQKEKNLKK